MTDELRDRLRRIRERLLDLNDAAAGVAIGHRREERPHPDDAPPAPPLPDGCVWLNLVPTAPDVPPVDAFTRADGRGTLLSRFYAAGDPAAAADLWRRLVAVLGELGRDLAGPEAGLPWEVTLPTGGTLRRRDRVHRAALAAHHLLRKPRHRCHPDTPDHFAALLARTPGAVVNDPDGRLPDLPPDPPPCGEWPGWPESRRDWAGVACCSELPHDNVLTALAEAVAVLLDRPPPRRHPDVPPDRFVPLADPPGRFDPADPTVYARWRETLVLAQDRFERLRVDGEPTPLFHCRVPLRWPVRWCPRPGTRPPELGEGPGPDLLWTEGLARTGDSPRPASLSLSAFPRPDGRSTGDWGPVADLLDAATDAGGLLPGLPAAVSARLWADWGGEVTYLDAAGLWLDALFALAWNPPPGPVREAEFFTVYPGCWQRQRGHGFEPWPLGMLPLSPWREPPGRGGHPGGEYRMPRLEPDADPHAYAPPPGPRGEAAVRRFAWLPDAAAASVAACELLLSMGGGILTGGSPPADPDPFADVRAFANDELTGKERRVVLALADAGGVLPLSELAVADGVDWNWPAVNAWNSLRHRVNAKLDGAGWVLGRRDNAARLERVG